MAQAGLRHPLRLPELVSHIFSYFDIDDDAGAKTLISCARVNKMWHKYASEIIWCSVDMDRLTGGTFGERDREPPAKVQWDRLNCHRECIRTLDITVMPNKSFGTFAKYIPRDMGKRMPWLKTLAVAIDSSVASLDTVLWLVAPSLKTLTLTIEPDSDVTTNEQASKRYQDIFSRFMHALAHLAPSLEELILTCKDSDYTGWALVADPFMRALPHIKNLGYLQLPFLACMSPGIVAYCAQMKNLDGLVEGTHCHDKDYYDCADGQPYFCGCLRPFRESLLKLLPPQPEDLDVTSSKLENISVCGILPSISQLFTNYLNLSILTKVDISLVTVKPEDNLRTLTRTLGTHSLQLEQCRISIPEAAPITLTSPPLPRLYWSTLAPLTACANMANFAISWDTFVVMTAADYGAIAHAWPELRELRIHGRRPHPDDPLEPTPPLNVLATLSAGCPRLTRLAIPLSPILPPDADGDVRPFERLWRCKLRIGWPLPVDALEDTALAALRYLDRVCPSPGEPVIYIEPELYLALDEVVVPRGIPHEEEWRTWMNAVEEFANLVTPRAEYTVIKMGEEDGMNMEG